MLSLPMRMETFIIVFKKGGGGPRMDKISFSYW
jgi:hypothetical protein